MAKRNLTALGRAAKMTRKVLTDPKMGIGKTSFGTKRQMIKAFKSAIKSERQQSGNKAHQTRLAKSAAAAAKAASRSEAARKAAATRKAKGRGKKGRSKK